MVLNFDQNKSKLALTKIAEQRYFDALCLLSGDNSYEGTLNKIGCLAHLDERFATVEQYGIAKDRFCQTHNLYADVILLSDKVRRLIEHEEKDKISVADLQRSDERISADKSLLGVFEPLDDEIDLENVFASLNPELNFDFFGDAEMFNDPAYSENNFFDLKSQRYRDHLRIMLERAYLGQDEKAFDKWYAKYFQADDCGDMEMVEYKLMLAVYKQRDNGIFPLIQKYLSSDYYTMAGLNDAFHLVISHNPQNHLADLHQILTKASTLVDEMTELDLEDYSAVAMEFCHDGDLAAKFADSLLTDSRNVNIQARKVCACVYYNNGNIKRATELVKEILSVSPMDCFSLAFLEMVHDRPTEHNRLDIAEANLRHFWLPRELSYQILLDATQYVDKTDIPFSSQIATICNGLGALAKQCVYYNEYETFNQVVTILRGLIIDVKVEEEQKDSFYKFARKHFSVPTNEASMIDVLIVKMINCGFRQKILIYVHGYYYTLDLSKLTITDIVFIEALAVGAMLTSVDVEEMQQNYLLITQKFPLKDTQEDVRKLVYALLSLSKNKSYKTGWSEYFLSADRALYREYKKSLKE